MKFKDRLLPVATIVVVMIVWFVAAEIYNVELILPKPSTAFGELWAAFGERGFRTGVGNTMLRALASFAVAFAAAFVMALLSVRFRAVRKCFYPLVVILRALPTISVIFICYVAVTGWFRAVIIAFLVIFPTLYASFYTAFEGCMGELADVGKVYKVKKRHILTHYIIPAVWSGMYSDIVNTLSLTVKLIIAAEAVTATAGSLGGLMAESKVMVDMGRIFAYTIAAIVLSYSTELVVRLAARVFAEVSKKWRSH